MIVSDFKQAFAMYRYDKEEALSATATSFVTLQMGVYFDSRIQYELDISGDKAAFLFEGNNGNSNDCEFKVKMFTRWKL